MTVIDRNRLIRGGSYYFDAWFLRATYRNWPEPGKRYKYAGFRIVVRRKKP